jgi:hypothetical protein
MVLVVLIVVLMVAQVKVDLVVQMVVPHPEVQQDLPPVVLLVVAVVVQNY